MLIENASSLSPSERQRIISSIKIEHDRYKEAVEGLRQFHYPVDGGLPGAGSLSMLVGDSRTGKSFSVTQYVKGFQPSIGDDGVKIPVLYVEAPVEGGVRGLLECLADGLRILHSRRMNSPSLLNLILKAFVEREVQLLVIDETQAIFRQENKRLLSFGRDLLRKILNLNTLNIICVGLVETYNVLRADAQLTGRGGLHYRLLQAYSWDSRDEQDSFRLLCHQLDVALPFNSPSGLLDRATAQRLYFVSDGIIGRLINFMRSAAYLAINDQSEGISNAHLARAFESQKPLGTSFNPFVHDLSHAPKARTVARQSDSAAQMFSKKGAALDARHRSFSSNAPPLPTWPRDVHPFEPVHGYAQRLAQRNGLMSVSTLMESLGYSGRRPEPRDLLRVISQLPGVDIDLLESQTPKYSNIVEVSGQCFRTRDVSICRPRVCSDCLRVGNYYRNWFDIQIIEACPIHNVFLEGRGENGEHLCWWYPDIGALPGGGEIVSRPFEGSSDWECYVLGRMGVLPRTRSDLLDGVSLNEITHVSLVLGRGVWRREGRLEQLKTRLSLAPTIRAGFGVLAKGADGIREEIERHIDLSNRGRLEFSMWEKFGWMRAYGAELDKYPFLREIYKIAENLASTRNIFSRKRLPSLRDIDRPATLNDLSKIFKLKGNRIIEIASYLQLEALNRVGGRWYSFSIDEVEQIRMAISGLVPRREAIKIAGLSRHKFQSLVDSGVIRPVTKIGGGSIGCDHFLSRDISMLANG